MVLKSFNLNIGRAIKAQAKSPVGYGLEFRKGGTLFPLLQNHPLWQGMKDLLEFGSCWPTEPIPKKDRITDLDKALKFGNHKGATTQPELLLKLVSGDIKHGYTLPLPLNKIK
jgi:hypothetical protein